MVKVTNISDRTVWRRLPSGAVYQWDAGQTRDVESKRLLEEVSRQSCFKITDTVGKEKVGGGVKTQRGLTDARRNRYGSSFKRADMTITNKQLNI